MAGQKPLLAAGEPPEIVNFSDTDAKQLHMFSKVQYPEWTSKEGHFLGNVRLARDAGLFSLPADFANNKRFVGAGVFCAVLMINVKTLLMTLFLPWPETLPIDMASRLAHFFGYPAHGMHYGGKAVALFEILGLCYFLIMICYYVFHILHPPHGKMKSDPGQEKVEQDYHRWYACYKLFRYYLPKLQTFSALGVLQYVMPAFIGANLSDLMSSCERKKYSKGQIVMHLIIFVLVHIVFFFFGFEAFLVKLGNIYPALEAKHDEIPSLIAVFGFLNQLLGVVPLQVFINERLFKFVFGGPENFMGEKEERRMRVWEAGLQFKAYEKAGKNVPKYIAAALTFNDVDFQHCVLDPRV